MIEMKDNAKIAIRGSFYTSRYQDTITKFLKKRSETRENLAQVV